jgi:hypothetical protein
MRAHGWYARALQRDNAARRQKLCAVRACSHQGRVLVEERRYCEHHARLYRDHYRILQRIRELKKSKLDYDG